MLRALVVSLFAAFTLSAQLQVNIFEGGVEKAAPSLYEAGAVQVGENLDIKFRIRNIGQTSVTLQSLVVSGSGFRATGYPSLPYIVAPEVKGYPATNVDFTIRFSPTNYGAYSASLTVNTTTILLRAMSSAGAILSSNGTALSAGATVDFGLVERGASTTRQFSLKNTTAVPVTLNSVAVTGPGFRGPVGITTPLQLPANAESTFAVTFEPAASGISQGTLQLDGRTFSLTATAKEPPFPRPSILLDNNVLSSGKQGKISVHLASASKAIGSGQLRIDFQPANGTVDNDAGIQFVTNSTRTLAFQVKEGDTDAKFGDAVQASFQTGTTAGTIVFTAEVGGYKETLNLTVAPASVQVDTATAARNGSSLDVLLAGYDNTRTISQMSFTFFNKAGQSITPNPLQVDAAADFRRYFDSSKLGGVFSVKASFPVTGSVSDIAGVEVQVQNASGNTKSQRLNF